MGYKPVHSCSMLMTALGSSFLLYSVAVVNPVQDVICNWLDGVYNERYHGFLGEAYLNDVWSVIVACLPLGAIFGALSTKIVAEKLGRRNGLVFNGVLAVAGSLSSLVCKPLHMPELLILGRLLHGFAMGLASGLAPMYMMEITLCRHRGIAGSVHQVAVAFADWFSLFMGLPEIFGGKENWQYALAFPGILSALMVCVLPFMPESPKYLIRKKTSEKARKAAEKLVNPVEANDFIKKLEKEKMEDFENHEGKNVYAQFITDSKLRGKIMVTILGILAQQATGCGAVFAFSTYMFVNVGIEGQLARFATVAIGIVYFLFTLMSSGLIERVGRRRLLLTQLFICGTSLASISFCTYMQEKNENPLYSYSAIASMIVYMAAYGLGSPVPWMIPNELFTTKHRSAAVTVSTFTCWTIMFIVSLTFMPLQQKLGMAFSYLPFVGATFACAIALYFFLGETRHRENPVSLEAPERQSIGNLSKDTVMTAGSDESIEPTTV
uniref:MFS domain-containing protein n=1 Tax=Panagrellus redivivus TaxID=6233 RepID=A0A7E4VV84_PANRE